MGKAVHTAMKVAALLALCLATAVLADAGASNDAEISFVETESKTQSKFVPFGLGWGLGYGFGFPFGYPYDGYGYSPFYPFMHNAARGFAAKAKAAQSFLELEEVDAQAGTQAQISTPSSAVSAASAMVAVSVTPALAVAMAMAHRLVLAAASAATATDRHSDTVIPQPLASAAALVRLSATTRLAMASTAHPLAASEPDLVSASASGCSPALNCLQQRPYRLKVPRELQTEEVGFCSGACAFPRLPPPPHFSINGWKGYPE